MSIILSGRLHCEILWQLCNTNGTSWSLNWFLSFSSSIALLDALQKNGSSAGTGPYRRRPAESADAQTESESQESGGGDSSKGFTKDQVDGVQRWESLVYSIMPCVFCFSHQDCPWSHFCEFCINLSALFPSVGIRPFICGCSVLCTHSYCHGNHLSLVPCPWGKKERDI